MPVHAPAPFPAARLRRLRRTHALRDLVAEHAVTAADLIWPVFIREGQGIEEPVASMPGVSRLSLDVMLRKATEAHAAGVGAICLFPYTAAALRTEDCAEAWNPENLTNRAIRLLKAALPDMAVMTSPGRWAVPDGMFSARPMTPTTFAFALRAAMACMAGVSSMPDAWRAR